MSPTAAVTLSGVKTKPSAPTCTVCVGEALAAVVLGKAEEEAVAAEEDEEDCGLPYWAMARDGVRRAERTRVAAVMVFMLAVE